MKHEMAARPVRAAILGTVALLCGAWVGAARADEEKAPEPLETELIRARNSMINASSKLKNDVLGIGPESGEGRSTPARSCCSSNLAAIEQAIRESGRILDEFDRCYESAGDTDMVLRARIARSDLSEFARTLPGFADATSKGEAQAALNTMGRTYTTLRKNAVGLAPCGNVALPAQSDAGAVQAQDPKKKGGKKKAQDEGSSGK